MIAQEKTIHALYALHQVLVHARFMAYQKEPHDRIAKLLDHAEILPNLIASADDRTGEFREYLNTIVVDYPFCTDILEKFDDLRPPEF